MLEVSALVPDLLVQWFSTIDVVQTPCGMAQMMEDLVPGKGKRVGQL